MSDTRHAWGRSPTRSAMDTPKNEPSPYLGSLGLSGDMYVDDASGTYTGTPFKLLTNPVSWIYAMLRGSNYGGETSFVTSTSQLGSWANARTGLNYWAGLGGASGGSLLTEWSSTYSQQEQLTVAETIGAMRQGLPEINVVRSSSGSWRCFTWIPRFGLSSADHWPSSHYYSSTDDALIPEDVLADGPTGPDIELIGADLSTVINRLKIEYCYNQGSGKYERTASVTPSTSDDGWGHTWPRWAGNGAEAHALSNWSENVAGFGRREIPGGSLQLPGVHDPRIAVACGWYLLARYYKPTVRCQFSASPALGDIQPGHVFRWSDTLNSIFRFPAPLFFFYGEAANWEQIYWLVQHAEVETVGGASARMVVTCEWYPQNIGLEVAGGFSGGGGSGEIGVIGELGEVPGEI